MRLSYDLRGLALNYGFNQKEIEKVCRISDVLQRISAIKFLSDRLSLIGGTALTFIYCNQITRLSVDLDFNYRYSSGQDWMADRKKIINLLKDILYRQGYEDEQIKMQISRPLTRIAVKYVNAMGGNDEFNIEIGFLRRISILKNDTLGNFRHIGTQETFKITTPVKEELFASKWCALLYRLTTRDLFDVYQISNLEFDYDIFRKCAIIDSFAHEAPKLYEINLTSLDMINLDSKLKNVLQTEEIQLYNFQEIKKVVKDFTTKHLSQITQTEKEAIDLFYDQRRFKPDLIDSPGLLHTKISKFPAALWTLKKLKNQGK